MRVLLQRVQSATVAVDGAVIATIGHGLLLLVGFCAEDQATDLQWAVGKLTRLRIFSDEQGVMNRSVLDVGGELLAVSQFTLYASTRKGNRPSWSRAAPPALAEPLFRQFVDLLAATLERPIPTGRFGADMQVSLINDGPVTLLLDSRQPE